MIFVKYKFNNSGKNTFKIIVSLKVSKKAVVRNKIKRRIREILKQAEIKPGYDIVVITTPEIVGKSFGEMKRRLLTNLKRCGIVRILV